MNFYLTKGRDFESETMNLLRKDTDLEVSSLSHSVESLREKLDDKINEHMGVAQRQIERVSQEMNTRNHDPAAELMDHVAQTNNDVVTVRQEMVELGEQMRALMNSESKTQ